MYCPQKSEILRRRRLLKDDKSGFLVILNEVKNLVLHFYDLRKGLSGTQAGFFLVFEFSTLLIKTKTQGIRNLKDLPENAKKYIHAIEDFIGARISSISTSPERDDTILVEDPFNN